MQAFKNYFSSIFAMPTNEINIAQFNSARHILLSNIVEFSPRLTYEALSKLNLDTLWILTYYHQFSG